MKLFTPKPPIPEPYIPEPIERQLAMYPLGTLLEVYKQMWARHGNRVFRLLIFLFTIFTLFLTIIGFIIANDVVQSTRVIVGYIFVIPALPAFAFVVGACLLFIPTLCLGVFSNGLVYARGRRVKVFLWEDIEQFDWETVKSRINTFTYLVLKIHFHDGRTIRIKAPYARLEKLAKIIRKNIV